MKTIEDTSIFAASLGLISEKYLSTFSAIRSTLVTCLLFIITFWKGFMLALFLSYGFFKKFPIFLILFLYLRNSLEKFNFMEGF